MDRIVEDPDMNNIHPKVGIAALAGLGLTAILLAVTQYAPDYAPNAALAGALTTFVTALGGFITPSPTPGGNP
jgi:hypothetical protein